MTDRDVWKPLVYDQFIHERQQPFFELLNLIEPAEDVRIVDLGCGTGELTRRLHDHLRAGRTLGIDRSQSMLAASDAFITGGLSFEIGDLTDAGLLDRVVGRLGGRVDLVFSHAALQWIPDHERLIRTWSAALTPRGQLAVQMPANDDHVTHITGRRIAERSPFRECLSGDPNAFRSTLIDSIDHYARLLNELGFARQHVRMQVFAHSLANREAMVSWVRGTFLTRYEKQLPGDLWARFLKEYRTELFSMVEDESPIFYPFKRVILWGSRVKRDGAATENQSSITQG